MNETNLLRITAATAMLIPDIRPHWDFPSRGGAENYRNTRSQKRKRRDMRRRYSHGW